MPGEAFMSGKVGAEAGVGARGHLQVKYKCDCCTAPHTVGNKLRAIGANADGNITYQTTRTHRDSHFKGAYIYQRTSITNPDILGSINTRINILVVVSTVEPTTPHLGQPHHLCLALS